MDTCCSHKSNHKGPRERGLFVAGSGFSLSRRAYVGWLGAAWLGLQQSAYASSFDDFFRAIAADSESDLVALALRNFDLNTRDERMEPPLVMALRLGSLKAFNFLEASGNLMVIFTDGEDTTSIVQGRSLDDILKSAVDNNIPLFFVLVRRTTRDTLKKLHLGPSTPPAATEGGAT